MFAAIGRAFVVGDKENRRLLRLQAGVELCET
jgi:hypothetical protein